METKGKVLINQELLKQAEAYAKKLGSSVSVIVEAHLSSLIEFDKASTSRRPIGFGNAPEVPNTKGYGDLLKKAIEEKLKRGDKR